MRAAWLVAEYYVSVALVNFISSLLQAAPMGGHVVRPPRQGHAMAGSLAMQHSRQ